MTAILERAAITLKGVRGSCYNGDFDVRVTLKPVKRVQSMTRKLLETGKGISF